MVMGNDKFQPMLSGKFDLDDPVLFEKQLYGLSYPVMCSPKVDGIRVLATHDNPVTRKIKAVPNHFVRDYISIHSPVGFDGEVVVGEPHTTGDGTDVFNRTTAIMAREGKPDFRYYIFDDFTRPDRPYWERLQDIESIKKSCVAADAWPERFHLLEYRKMESPSEVLQYEAECLERGYEGIMIRSPFGYYKFGRSTLKQQGLIKLKRVETADATIVGYEQKTRNENEQKQDAFGYAKRSSHKENKVLVPMLGSWICKSSEFKEPFNIGCGWDHASATKWWEDPGSYVNRVIEFKYQKVGTIDKPRHPIFLRFRAD